MDLDLETFLTALYVIVDDFYQSHIQPQMPARGGPQAEMSDREVLCLGLAAQWRSGVPWKTERGVLRSVHKTPQTFVSHSPQPERLQPTPATPVGGVHPAPRRRGRAAGAG